MPATKNICLSLVDIYSLKGKIIEENVWLTHKSNSIAYVTNLASAYFDKFK